MRKFITCSKILSSLELLLFSLSTIFYGGLNDRKHPMVSRTLLSILAVVSMVSILPLFSNCSSHFFFGGNSKGTNFKWYHSHFHSPQLFQLPGKIQVFVNLFVFFYLQFTICLNSKIRLMTSTFLFVN